MTLLKLSLLIFALSTQSSFAASYCVTSTNELVLALLNASQSNENNHIKLKPGHYVVPNGGFKYQSTNNNNLTLSGGWFGVGQVPCLLRNGSVYSTELDGNSLHRVLEFVLSGSPQIELLNLSIINGQAPISEPGGAVLIPELPAFTGTFLMERVFFANNKAQIGGAVSINNGELIEIRNNIFYQNNSFQGGGCLNVSVAENSKLFVSNNNFIENYQSNIIRNAITGLKINSSNNSFSLTANNIFWGNELIQFSHFGSGLSYVFNNLLSQEQEPTSIYQNNIFANPDFEAGPLNFTPKLTSPLLNKGTTAEENMSIIEMQQWQIGDFDFEKENRIFATFIDIGAIEVQAELAIFENGFEI